MKFKFSRVIHDHINLRIFYILIFIISFFYSLIKIKTSLNNYKIIKKIINNNCKAFIGMMFSYANTLLVIRFGSKLINKSYLDKNLIINGDLKKDGLYISKHVGTSGFLNKIFSLINKEVVYIRDKSHKDRHFAEYVGLYKNEYIFNKPSDSIKVTKKMYSGKSIYISVDGKINSKQINLNENITINYSDVFVQLAYKKNIPIYNISTSLTLSGKLLIDIKEFEYSNKNEEKEVFLNRFKDFYIKEYIDFIRLYPYGLRFSRYELKD